MKFAISPCPNDTFSFYALIKKVIASDFEFVFDDIENLNLSAEKKEYPITKLSFAQFLNVKDNYELLDAGSALGIGTGPVLVGKSENIDKSKPIAVPGLNTTASLLLKYYLGKDVILEPMYFRDVAERVARAIKVSAKKGVLDLKDFPLLMHIDEILIDKNPVNIPWESFTFVK